MEDKPNLVQDIEHHTVIMLLCFQINKHLPTKLRALKISRAAKYVRNNTRDKQLHSACTRLVETTRNGKYDLVIHAMQRTQDAYYMEGGYTNGR